MSSSTSLMLKLAFLATLFAVPLVDIPGFFRDASTLTETIGLELFHEAVPPTRERLLNGDWARGVQDTVVDASLSANTVRPLYTDVTFGLFSLVPKEVVLGREDWLYSYRYLVPEPGSRLATLSLVVAEAARQGIPVALALVPGKDRIYPEFLPYRAHPERQALYDRLLALARTFGLPTVDLRRHLLQEKDLHPDRPLYLRNDTHGTTWGLLVMAATIAEDAWHADPARVQSLRDALFASQDRPRPYVGDLQRMLGFDENSSYHDRFRVEFAEPKAPAVRVREESRHLWVGDSHSRRHDHFIARTVAHVAGWPDICFVDFLVGWQDRILARLRASEKPESLTFCLTDLWFDL